MKVLFLEENHRRKFAVLSYRDFIKLVKLAADKIDYQKALKVLRNKKDKILDYNTAEVLKKTKRPDLIFD